MTESTPVLQGFISVVSSAVNTGVWDVVYAPGDLPVLVVHCEDRMKWWAGAKAGLERVFEVEGFGEDGVPLIMGAKEKWFGDHYAGWRCRVLVVEPPVSFGFVLVWVGLTGEEQTRLAEVLNTGLSQACGVAFRVTKSGVVQQVKGKEKESVDFPTPWGLWIFLEKILGEPKVWCNFLFPVFLRSYCPWGLRVGP